LAADQVGRQGRQLIIAAPLNRPGANVTGVSILISEVQTKRMELLRDLIPLETRPSLIGSSPLVKQAPYRGAV
jgi:hypothetical protein